MKLIRLLFLIVVSSLSFTFGWVQFRDKFESSELYYVCDTIERAEQVFAAADMMNKIAIIWTVFDVNMEPYFKLYLEYILELTKGSDTVHVVLESSPRDTEFLPTVLQYVPPKSLFVMIHDSDFRFDMCLLSLAKKYLGQERAVIFHMNHERPWIQAEHIGMKASLSHCTTKDLPAIYPTYSYVYRNYYYKDYLNITEYLPLLSLQPRIIQQYRSTVGLKPLSQRKHWCRFAGRVNYDSFYTIDSPFHSQREEFLKLLQTETSAADSDSSSVADRHCVALYDIDGGNNDGHKLTFEEYVEYLADTVFAPCPAGNSPETFRHYEAMELGLIPIMVRPPPEVDFLQAWEGYPGPIFSSWPEAMNFIHTVDASTIDNLQTDIFVWYNNFRDNVYAKFSDKLNSLFHSDEKKHYSKLCLDKTNGPTAAAQLLQYTPTTRPSLHKRSVDKEVQAVKLHSDQRLDKLETALGDVLRAQESLMNALGITSQKSDNLT